ncbi:MAG: mobile mystery protein A [Actinomycetia bacterium]|nr:mobile mystery protein A [Actinomycetes bacterium]
MARRSTSRQLEQNRHARVGMARAVAPLVGVAIPPPNKGWIKATREALGMSRQQMADRMGVSVRRIPQIEEGEQRQAIKLDTLRRAAEALDCDLLYAIVPRGSYDETIERQAATHPTHSASRAAHTMRLENQEPGPEVLARLVAEHTAELLESGKLWGH